MLEGSLSGMLWPLPDTTARQLDATAKIYPSVKIARSVQHLVMEKGTFIGDFCFVSVPDLYMAEGSQVNSGTRITGTKPVRLGKNSVVSYACTLITASDSPRAYEMNDASPLDKRILEEGEIDIGPRVFLGAHSIIMPGVSIASGIVVKAFSYVAESLDTLDSVYGGQPASLLYHRPYR